MGQQLMAELKQTKPFSNPAEEALLNLHRTADCFRRELQQTLKPSGITETQYNVLRILRGAVPEGLACSEVGQRLVSSDPDITRLLDRLARQGLISRQRGSCDKRVVLAKITASGLSLLDTITPVMDDAVCRAFAHMHVEQLNDLIDLLETARLPLTRSACDQHRAAVQGEVA